MTDPAILHFHDCADVAGALVRSAAKQGWSWDYLSAEDVRPTIRSGNKVTAFLSRTRRNYRRIAAADLVHAHYATVVPLLKLAPKRPYYLHLHGTDIRTLWARPDLRPRIQRWIDGAERVFYTNLDTVEQATTADPTAEYMPAFVEPDRLAPWNPHQRTAIFLSRWDDIKGAKDNIELARELRRAYPDLRLEGIDWGTHRDLARHAGIHLVPKMDHPTYAQWISAATLGIGQAQPMLGVSEFEAMATGLPVAVLGSRIPRPDDGSVPPVLEGRLTDVVEQIGVALDDPHRASEELDARAWVLAHHLPGPYATKLDGYYRQTLSLPR